MAVILASLHDKQAHKGRVFRTSVGTSNGMGAHAGLAFLYPTWDMVMGYKRGVLTDEEYTKQYLALMQERWPRVKQWIASLDADVDYTLLCHCSRDPKFCHRQLIGRMIRKWRPDIAVIEH